MELFWAMMVAPGGALLIAVVIFWIAGREDRHPPPAE